MSNATAGKAVAIVFPAFTRSAAELSGFVAKLTDSGFDARAITLAPRALPTLYCYRRHLRAIANAICEDNPNRPIIVMGHSAGAAAATYVAQQLMSLESDIRGVVLIDGVDSPNHLIAKSLPLLDKVNVGAVLASPSPCNRHGLLGRQLATYPLVRVMHVPGAGHGDIEGNESPVYRRVCGDRQDPQTMAEFQNAVIGMAQQMFGWESKAS